MKLSRRTRLIHKLDWLSIVLYVALVGLGWLSIYSAKSGDMASGHLVLDAKYTRQLIWLGASVIMIFVIFLIDSKFYSAFSYVLYGIGLVLLLGVLVFGREVHGAKSWFEMGAFRLQPAEFTKTFTALGVAQLISYYNFTFRKFKYVILSALMILVPVGLIFLQNDAGTALVFLSFIFVLFREGLSGSFLLILGICILFFLLALIIPLYWVVAIIFCLAMVFFWLNERNSKALLVAFLIPLLIAGALTGLNQFIDNDLSIASIASISLVAGALVFLPLVLRLRSATGAVIIALVLGFVIYVNSVDYVFYNVLGTHQQERIEFMLGVKDDPLGAGYNVNQSKIAIGSGGLAGKGFLQGTQTKFDFVPEQSTDFIFCTVGEEFGFIGTTIVVMLFAFLILRVLMLAERQRSQFSRVYGYAVAGILFFHVFVNIGMTIGLSPVIGIPLPFFSYGGSSLMAFTLLLFVFLRLDANRLEVFR